MLLTLLDRFAYGGIVLDAEFRMVARNDLADRLVGTRTEKSSALSQRQLQLLADTSSKTIWLPRRRLGPLLLHLIPAADLAGDFSLLVLIDPSLPFPADEAVAQYLFRLTESEAKLVVRLSRGERPRTIARARGVTMGTVRSQLRAIFAKTKTAGQIELALLLARIAVVQLAN